jgi:hypothetical protein
LIALGMVFTHLGEPINSFACNPEFFNETAGNQPFSIFCTLFSDMRAATLS